ncbi:MAG: glycosyltransferase family 39 protein [Candidatus Saccharibacteria bacterium]|nr:glycosyltransferase family 39 protein [Candidatus Saccharibacteria bacterium]
MGKLVVSKLFLYKHRFVICYVLLALAFLTLMFGLPIVTPNGLSESEIESAVTAYNITDGTLASGDIVDLPYHLLQKLSISIFGLTPYAIKLPSILIGVVLGFVLILLLNRWFKNNVAAFSSILAVLCSSFLFISGSGTPLIMFVFWPTLLLWLGSKIQGVNKPKPLYCFFFAFALLGAIFTPFMIYLALFIVILVIFNPHLRFTVKSLPKIPFLLTTMIVVAGCSFIIMNAIKHPTSLTHLLFMEDFSILTYFQNIANSLTPFFSWNGRVESTFLAPLISLPTLALALIGLISTAKGFLASRNSIATYLIIFTLLASGFNPDMAVLLTLPCAILIAHGLRYILNKWYGIFPENPYARVFGVVPIALFMGIMIYSDITHFFFGYRYNPPVSNQFSTDLALLDANLNGGDTLLVPEDSIDYEFYKIYAEINPLITSGRTVNIATTAPDNIVADSHLITMGHTEGIDMKKYDLFRIVTNSKSQNSDRIYIYTLKTEK